MYLWNTNALAKELKEGTLSEREKFKYLLVSVVLQMLMLELINYMPTDYSHVAALVSILNILAVVVGTYLCYETNQDGDGVKFVERYICLSLPISVKILVLFILAYILLGIVLGVAIKIVVSESDIDDVLDWLGNLLLFATTIIFYWRLNVHIKSISHNDTQAVPA